MKFTAADLEARYEQLSSNVVCIAEFATQLAGGVPAAEDGIRAFVRHHLKIEDSHEAESAVQRILAEEVGEKPVPEAEGELDERLTYGVNVIRRTSVGPYLGNWMIHACLKQAASRLKIFTEFRGAKGNFAEAGRVVPVGASKRDEAPDHIYLVDANGKPARTYWEEFKGRVQTPHGNKSVVHHTECAPAGTRFEFEFRFLMGDLSETDVADFLALAMIVGLGSVKSLGCGKFRILSAEINKVAHANRNPKKKKKGDDGVEVVA
jgi:hypothetical protein